MTGGTDGSMVGKISGKGKFWVWNNGWWQWWCWERWAHMDGMRRAWRKMIRTGWRNEAGSWFQRQVDAYRNKQFVILDEKDEGHRGMVTTDEEEWVYSAVRELNRDQLMHFYEMVSWSWMYRYGCIGEQFQWNGRLRRLIEVRCQLVEIWQCIIILDMRKRLETGQKLDCWSLTIVDFLSRGDMTDYLRMGRPWPELRDDVGDSR